MDINNDHSVAIVMAPYPTPSHFNPLLHLSRKISAFKIHVHFVSVAPLMYEARSQFQASEPYIHFHPVTIPPSNSSSSYPKSVQALLNSKIALWHLGEPIHQLVNELKDQFTRVIMIFDFMTTTVQHINHVESYCFHTWPAFTFLSFVLDAHGKPRDEAEDSILKQAPSIEECSHLYPPDTILQQMRALNFHSGTIVSTSRLIEGLYLDLLDKTGLPRAGKHWALGPLFNPEVLLDDKIEEDGESKLAGGRHRCLLWLDKQPPNSVIYVAFGTAYSPNDEQLSEIALGLEKSGHKFIWVLKDEGESALPKGYEDNVKGRGIVVSDWAPQLEILRHSATGGFMTHCGWNSCAESILTGIPVATWPMQFDHPLNAELLTKVLRMGLVLRDWALRDELVPSGTVEKAVRRLMSSAEGDVIRKRATEIGENVMKSLMEDGAGHAEMTSFIHHITK